MTMALTPKRLAGVVSHGYWILGNTGEEIQHVSGQTWRVGYSFNMALLRIVKEVLRTILLQVQIPQIIGNGDGL